jgi:xanthine/uracil/vitamin C permease (AzgA family)
MRSGFVYLRKWTLLSIMIGAVARLGALALVNGIGFFTSIFLGTIAGYVPPLASGEARTTVSAVLIERPWLIPVSTTLEG